jgi:hypothetical protein
VPSPANPQSLNRYSYCLNNPLKYVDPTGHMDDHDLGLDIPDDWDDYLTRYKAGAQISYSQYAKAKQIGLGAGDSIRNTFVGTFTFTYNMYTNPLGTVYGFVDGLISGDTVNGIVEQWNSGTRGQACLITDGVIIIVGFIIGGEVVAGVKTTRSGIISEETLILNELKVGTKGKISGFPENYADPGHQINGILNRNGHGVNSQSIIDAVNNPLNVVPQVGEKLKYIGTNATAVLNKAGGLITTWATNHLGWRW